jgi:hypothetical protein
MVQHLDLQAVLGMEMPKQAALRDREIVSQVTDRETGKTDLTRELRGAVQDRVTRRVALAHDANKSTNVRSVNTGYLESP